MLVLIFVFHIFIKRENPLERGSPIKVEVNTIASYAMACAARVPLQKNGPCDGCKLCALKLINLVVLSYIFYTFPYLCACSALSKSRLALV